MSVQTGFVALEDTGFVPFGDCPSLELLWNEGAT